ncbi:MAG TPA: ribosome small subunit-dependent GTPase A [Myxococcaceae bacterium]|nr:ribosome small subunit-dependent GTPase A [Myxococcaceae bacterium]
MPLAPLGYDAHFARALEALAIPGAIPARVITEYGLFCRVITEQGEWQADLPGRMRHRAVDRTELPAVGDWVALEPLEEPSRGLIRAVLPRRSAFIRRAAGKRAEPQVLAANVDVALLVMGLDQDFSVRRLERFVALADEGGARPVVVLNKEDLCLDPDALEAEVRAALPEVTVQRACAVRGEGLEPLHALLHEGTTLALLGSSGVGKSTLINRLIGEEVQAVGDVRAFDGTGRHTTTRRELIPVRGGGVLLDTPGLREVQPWGREEALEKTFDDIFELAAGCRFSDCRHLDEPGCAVRAAIEAGTLDPARLENLRRMQQEVQAPDRRAGIQASAERRRLEQAAARRKAPKKKR